MKRGALGPDFDGPLFAHGFSLRKRRFVRDFAARDGVRFVSRGNQVAPGAHLLLWGSAPLPPGTPADVRVVRVEDGFLRSVGLGADLVRPLSWVFDEQGIYYDARTPSALEGMLADGRFTPGDLARARDLRERIVQAGVTKYNLAAPQWMRPAGNRKVVLVTGQVETDASILYGTTEIRTNLALLQAVREACPGDYIVYKPHPDVVAGLRGRSAAEDQASTYCDEVVTEGSMHDLLQQVDEVHVLTSLAGFEALLRGKPVVCWGHPFYAGWGLTRDSAPHPRRTRALSLDQLVCAALMRYAVYCAARTGDRCSAEQGLQELIAWRMAGSSHRAWWRRWLRPLIARP